MPKLSHSYHYLRQLIVYFTLRFLLSSTRNTHTETPCSSWMYVCHSSFTNVQLILTLIQDNVFFVISFIKPGLTLVNKLYHSCNEWWNRSREHVLSSRDNLVTVIGFLLDNECMKGLSSKLGKELFSRKFDWAAV